MDVKVVSALDGRAADGFARVREAGLQGMVLLRADLASPGLAAALAAEGLRVPPVREIAAGAPGPGEEARRAALWMSPDELLLLCPHAEAPALAARLGAALAEAHALVVEISDARALFRIEGAKADQVLRKLCPADLAALGPREVRRTRAAQIAVAFWREEGGYALVCFRSVAGYAFDLLADAARHGSAID